VAECDTAFSIALQGALGITSLHVGRHTVDTKMGIKPVLPTLINIHDGVLGLNYLMLGNRRLPRLCRGNFRTVMRAADYPDVDESFDRVRMLNQGHFLGLLGDLEELDGLMVRQLRRMARLQLRADFCFGAWVL
jgi:hypothetical protein